MECRASGASTSVTVAKSSPKQLIANARACLTTTASSRVPTRLAIELAGLLSEVTPPQFKRVFYAGSGPKPMYKSCRMVRGYWDVCGEPNRNIIISRDNAYHGSTM